MIIISSRGSISRDDDDGVVVLEVVFNIHYIYIVIIKVSNS